MTSSSSYRPPKLSQSLAVLLATGLGVGRSRFVPGTLGSLWAVIAFGGLHFASVPPLIIGGIAAALFVVGIPLCRSAAETLGMKDPGCIVWDEIVALLLLMATQPFHMTSATMTFFWFRLFDMSKPWPIRHVERIGGGLGIMIDDIFAAGYALAALKLTENLLRLPIW